MTETIDDIKKRGTMVCACLSPKHDDSCKFSQGYILTEDLRNALIRRCKELMKEASIKSDKDLKDNSMMKILIAGAWRELKRFGNLKDENLK
jgi:hypothetical protein